MDDVAEVRRRSVAPSWRHVMPAVVGAVLAAALATSDALAADQWFKTDLHRHSVLSGDGRVDLGIIAQNMRSLGYNAILVTDHDRGSDFQIQGATANRLTVPDPYPASPPWEAPRNIGTLSTSTNAFVTTPVHSGTQSLRLAASSSSMGETMLYDKRGPNLRSGAIILDFWVNPASIGAGSGVYASASIGGDDTIVTAPAGYTNTAGVATTNKTNVLVWQVGTPRAPSSTVNRRVITQNLPFTLNTWNHYTINISTGATTWNGATVSATNSGLQSLAAADQPDAQNAVTYVKLAARSNGTPVDAYIDDVSLTASAPVCPATEFVNRNAQISNFNTPDFVMLPGREMGQTKHTQQLNFGLADPRNFEFPGETALCGATNTPTAPFHFRRFGSDNIPDVHASGYPAINNHPGATDTVAEAISTRAHGADGIEAYNGLDFTDTWDAILGQDYPITGSAGSDAHEIGVASSMATYLRAPALALDDLMPNYYEGRLYLGLASFGGRMVLNLDGSSEPYPGRHPLYVPASQTAASVSLSISSGLLAGDTIRWVTNDGSGAVQTTVTQPGGSYQATRTIPLSGTFTYVRAEVRTSAGKLRALTQPIFFRRLSGLPAAKSLRVDRITTSSGRGYTNVSTRGITACAYDTAADSLSATLTNPAGTRTTLLGTSSTAPQSVTVDGGTVPAASSLAAYQLTLGSSWFYDAAGSRLYLQVVQPGATAKLVVAFGPAAPADTQAPTVPGGVAATPVSTSQIDVGWTQSTDDVGVTGYHVRRDGAVVATLGAAATSFSDTGLATASTHSYTVDAFDAAGNISAQSASVSATTSSAPPPPPPPPGTITLNPVADAYVSDGSPTTNFGTATTLRVDGAAPVQLSYLRFDVAGLTGPPASAVLRVFANSSQSTGYGVFGVPDTTWIESGTGSITFSNAPPPAATATGSSGPAAGGSYTSVVITPLITGNGLVSVALKTTNSTALSLASRQVASTVQRPELVITP